MRQLLRAGVIGLLLVFGIPAAVLLLAHAGVIRMPSDPYLRSVTEVAPANAVQDYAHVLGRADTVEAPRNVVARSAIEEAAAQLPGHIEGVERDWSFYRVSQSGFRYPLRTTDARATVRVACADCDDNIESALWISARVSSLEDGRAHVVVGWVLTRTRRTLYDRNGAETGGSATDTGRLAVTLAEAGGRWRAVSIQPQR
jgi:hypothetical protein